MSSAINWDHLQKQYSSDHRYSEILSKLCKIVDNPFSSGLAQIPGMILFIYDQLYGVYIGIHILTNLYLFIM